MAKKICIITPVQESTDLSLQYEHVDNRSKTYTLDPPWEGPLDAPLMAEAGFVYTGQEDLVYCFSCTIKLDGWTKHMDPLLRHKEESPTCSFVRQQLQVIKGEKRKVKSVVAPSKPLNPRQAASIGQLQSQASTLFSSKPIHTVVTGLDKPQSSYAASRSGDDFCLPINIENYRSEEERLKSYVGWPLNESVHPEQLARVGFVYTGEGSLVQCFQCGVRYRNWLKGDVPLSVHQRCNPRCVFLQTLTSKTKSIEEQKPNFLFIEPEGMSPTTQNENVTLEFPTYDDEATRLQSFKYWGGVLPKEELAEAGFYFVARRDVVRCFSCHVVLQDWERTDNVIEKHQRHSPKCAFLKIHLYNISASLRVSSKVDKTYSLEKSTEMKNRDHQSSQFGISLSGLDIRQPPSDEKSSCKPGFIVNEGLPIINEGLPIRNKDVPTSTDAKERPAGIRYPPSWCDTSPAQSSVDRKRTLNLRAQVEKGTFQSSLNPQGSICPSDSSDDSDDKRLTDIIGNRANPSNIWKPSRDDVRNDDVEEYQLASLPRGMLCHVCSVRLIDCIFLPCGHARTCRECATRIKNSGQPCPYCRRSVSTTHQVIL